MSPEAQIVFFLIALVAFAFGAIVSFARPWPTGTFFACVGLSSWVIVLLWTAIKAA